MKDQNRNDSMKTINTSNFYVNRFSIEKIEQKNQNQQKV